MEYRDIITLEHYIKKSNLPLFMTHDGNWKVSIYSKINNMLLSNIMVMIVKLLMVMCYTST